MRRIVPGDVIEPLFHCIDADGVNAWEPTGAVTVTETTRIEDKALPDGTYYLTFTMADILEHNHTTSTVEVQIENGRVYYS